MTMVGRLVVILVERAVLKVKAVECAWQGDI